MENKRKVKLSKGGKPGLAYGLFKLHVRLVHNLTYYRNIHYAGRENIPQNCPLVIVSNHQNSLNDALGLLFASSSRGKRKIRAITRADAFEIPVLGFIMHGLGLLPAFRLSYGVESLSHNTHAFDEASDELLLDGTIIIYPESGHQDRRWLGPFTYGYLRMAFEAAEKSGFEKEIFILPACNHYSDYFNPREDILIKFGKPLSLAPYYERYRQTPRTVQRELNGIIRRKVSELMLDIRDSDNYDTIDFIRNSYGRKYAEERGLNPANLADRLISDKRLVEHLAATADRDALTTVYADAAELNLRLRQLKISDDLFDERPSALRVYGTALLLVVLLPAQLLALVANGLVFGLPRLVNRRIDDVMLHASFKIALPILVAVPLTNLIVFFTLMATAKSLLVTAASMLSLPFLYIFAVGFDKIRNKCISRARFLKLSKRGKLSETVNLRTKVLKGLDDLLK
ncbi:MAG: 1-acyl-sn-glycerol-3-phosphate acyltransferase [Prevotellaceae bacterium]|nr:1-acyl-sn-glycerol-3-phosphate acyltransferase [Prevotellaceae bacterium]